MHAGFYGIEMHKKMGYLNILYFIFYQGRVVRKQVNVNPGINVNWSITFSDLNMFFTSNVWCGLGLLQLKTEGQSV